MKHTFKIRIAILMNALLVLYSYAASKPGAEFSNNTNHGSGITVSIKPTITTQQPPHIISLTPSVFSKLTPQAIQKFSTFTSTQWHNYVSNQFGGLSVHLLSQADRNKIFCHFTLYKIQSFRNYIAQLEGYHEAMIGLNHQLMHDKHFAHQLSHVSLNRRLNAKDFIISEAQKAAPIVAQKHEQLVRAQQAAIAKHQQQIAQLKAEASTTLKSQHEHFAAVVEEAKQIEQPRNKQDTKLLGYAYAIKESIENNFATSNKQYALASYTDALLRSIPHINNDRTIFTECHGTTAQKFVHNELVSNLNRIAYTLDKHRDNASLQHVAQSVAEFTEVGIQYNNAGYVKQAMAISDLTAALADYGSAIALGVKDGITNVGLAALHPVDTITNIAQSAATVGYHLGKVLYEVGDIAGTYMIDPVAGTEKFVQYQQNISAIYREINEKYNKLSGPEIARAVTSTATEAWLIGKCLGAAQTFYGHAHAKTLDLAAKIEQGLATAPELLASAEGLEIMIANEAAETVMLSTAENAAAGSKRVVSSTLKAMHEPIAWHELDPVLGDLTKLQKSEEFLKSIPQANNTKDLLATKHLVQHPVAKLVEHGKIGGDLSNARGALYELEIALNLKHKGETITEFGRILNNGKNAREFDIITSSKLIECKNIDWTTITDIGKYKSHFQQQNLIAQHHNKIFELYSKQVIPESWREWFMKNNIIFHEGT